MSKTDDGETIYYVNDINLTYEQVLQTYDDDGIINTYTYGIERIQSQGVDNETYLYDGRGSVAGTINQDNILESYSYTAYGELMPSSPAPNVWGYNAEATDSKTGLQYLRASYYDTNTGRFISEDIWRGDYTEPVSLNRYAYVYNDPVNYVDISGYRRLESMDADRHGAYYKKTTTTSSHESMMDEAIREKKERHKNAAAVKESNSSTASNNSNLVTNPYSDVIGAEKVTIAELIHICKEYERIMAEEEEEDIGASDIITFISDVIEDFKVNNTFMINDIHSTHKDYYGIYSTSSTIETRESGSISSDNAENSINANLFTFVSRGTDDLGEIWASHINIGASFNNGDTSYGVMVSVGPDRKNLGISAFGNHKNESDESVWVIDTYSPFGFSSTNMLFSREINGSQVVTSSTITKNKTELEAAITAAAAVIVFTPADEIAAAVAAIKALWETVGKEAAKLLT